MKDHAQFAEDLALYAMGSLDDQACPEMLAHLSVCGECRSELEALRADVALLALSATGPQPPRRARQRLMEAVASRQREEEKRQASPALGRLWPRWFTLTPAALTLALAVFSIGLLLQVQRLKDVNALTAQKLLTEHEKAAHAQEILDMLNDPKAQHMTLVAVKTPPQPQVKTIYVRDKGHVLLMASNLPELPADKAYELWLLPANGGSPMRCGTFKTDWRGHGMMLGATEKAGLDAKGFAVTIEPQNGSQTPTPPIVMEPGN